MSKAVIARMQGDDYQALYFWYKACGLFHEHTKIKTISYEYDEAKAFDDVVIEYEKPIADELDRMIYADFYQIKFHVTHGGEMTCRSLIEPSFINATSISFLQRLKDAVFSSRELEKECRFCLVTPWGVPLSDQLAELLSTTGGELRLDKLMVGITDGSRMGQIRKMWREHLSLDDDQTLLSILEAVRIYPNSGSIKDLTEKLNYGLISSGFSPIEEGTVTHKYVDLVKGLLKKRKFTFTKEELIEKCKIEGLWIGNSEKVIDNNINLGIRSFYRWAENMENETNSMLCLTKYFNGRYIKDIYDWKSDISRNIIAFIKENIVSGNSYNLHLDAHHSVAFFAGHELDVKSGISVAPVQKGYNGQKQIWRPSDINLSGEYIDWMFKEISLERGNDVAVAISATHDISEDVGHYINQAFLPIGRIISCFVDNKGPRATSVKDANHASFLANQVSSKMKTRNIKERLAHLHIFYAGPNGLLFFIGQFSKSFGPCTLYEFDFTKQTPGGYKPSITLPINEEEFQ